MERNHVLSGTDLDPSERKFRAESKFHAERMSQTEPLNIYYDRFKMRFQQCKNLGIIGLQDAFNRSRA